MSRHRKLGRPGGHRNTMLRNLVTSLLREERITTTVPRARAVTRMAERMITLGKRGDLAARRQALAYIWDEEVVVKLFSNIAPRYADRQGGYTRLMRLGPRRGDAAPMAILELV
ncbi:MAG: 50S ribosomal protein L17 [Firmicutes bacterium]|nr:50S ribosomal protein L17 [Alicyclobacillaceae bacterium]MCL6497992.1 50S ribosomal protein L17 [Bacillota bacterium]